jgi:hypothetical protein
MTKNIFKIYKKDKKPSQETIKRRFLEYLKDNGIEQKCCFEDCPTHPLGNSWRGKSLQLIMDHKNGNNWDNRLENLRLICPNCNAQLETHGGKNKKEIEEIFDNGYYTVRKGIQEMVHIGSGGAVVGGSAEFTTLSNKAPNKSLKRGAAKSRRAP